MCRLIQRYAGTLLLPLIPGHRIAVAAILRYFRAATPQHAAAGASSRLPRAMYAHIAACLRHITLNTPAPHAMCGIRLIATPYMTATRCYRYTLRLLRHCYTDTTPHGQPRIEAITASLLPHGLRLHGQPRLTITPHTLRHTLPHVITLRDTHYAIVGAAASGTRPSMGRRRHGEACAVRHAYNITAIAADTQCWLAAVSC